MTIDERIDRVLFAVFDAGVNEERQQLDFHTSLYETKKSAHKAIKQRITEARIEEVSLLLEWQEDGNPCICEDSGVRACDYKWSLCNQIKDRIATLKKELK
jgi:hypothetical protein